MDGHKVVLCSIGPGLYQDTAWGLDGKVERTPFAVVGLARIRSLAGWRVKVLTTQEAQRGEGYRQLQAAFGNAGLDVEPVTIPTGTTRGEILQIVEIVIESVPQQSRVILDITQALRHLPFALYTALIYLTAYSRISLDGVYYGAFASPEEEKPIVDLTSLFELSGWFHALQSLQDTGSVKAALQMFNQENSRLGRAQSGGNPLSRFKRPLEELSASLQAGLPLETGQKAAKLVQDWQASKAAVTATTSLLERTLDKVFEQAQQWSVAQPVSDKKSDINLSQEELERQLRLTRWFIERGQLPIALLQLREWLVSYSLLRDHRASTWLEKGEREQVAHQLHVLVEREHRKLVVSPAESKVSRLWASITELRDRFAHLGMLPEQVGVSRDKMQGLLKQCDSLLTCIGQPLFTMPHAGKLLVTPLGRSPGVIFTAVKRLQPERLIVVVSEETGSKLDEALRAAGAASLPCDYIQMEDPYSGFAEAERMLTSGRLQRLLDAEEVIVNLTGGTSVMQYVVDYMAREAAGLGAKVKRVALVDRRSLAEQQADPYVIGECIALSTH